MKLIIIRGLPGAGKTTLAHELMSKEDAIHFEADHFHANCGKYEFNPLLLGAAHDWCFGQAMYNLKQGTNVIVSNTFTRIWELERYIINAGIISAEIEIEIIHVISQFQSIHDVPEKTFKSMKQQMVSNDKVNDHFKDFHCDISYREYSHE